MFDAFHTPTSRCHTRQESTGRTTNLEQPPGFYRRDLPAIGIENLFCRKFPKPLIGAVVWKMCASIRTIILRIVDNYRLQSWTRICTHQTAGLALNHSEFPG